jgi:AcrR family transcriptional regulator
MLSLLEWVKDASTPLCITVIQDRISAGLERAFTSRGFTGSSVKDLRDGVGVSLRTLYKYPPTRAVMVLSALENPNRRRVACVFGDLRDAPTGALDTILTRVGD